MNEMTLTLNGKLINATQCTDKYQGIPGSVRCSTQNVMLDNGTYGKDLCPIPPGIQTFGPSAMGVLVQGNKYQEMHEGDWYLVRHGEKQGVVMDNASFQYVFRDELHG